jgi:hypothetical protein
MGKAVFCLVVLVVVAAGCGGSEAPLARFSDGGMSFSYPARWGAHHASGFLSMESGVTVALSTEQLHNSCHVRHHANGVVTGETCGLSLMLNTSLPRGGVFVAWTGGGWPGVSLAAVQGRETRIGGLPAKVIVNGSGWPQDPCPSFGATTSVAGVIATRPFGWVEMNACQRGGNAARFEAQVLAMLRSVSFRTSSHS